MNISDDKKYAIIIGAGPAGLTAAFELLKRTDLLPIIFEKSGYMGGISKTVNYKGNRIDIGGHRFFSKSDRVMDWWLNILPLEAMGESAINISYQNKVQTFSTPVDKSTPVSKEKVMLLRNRVSRIYYRKKFFNYPVKLNWDTVSKLGFIRMVRIVLSYARAKVSQVKPEKNLEDFFINRFGKTLYETFFKDYTEKVWGMPCSEIPAEWGAQRIKELSISKTIIHALRKKLRRTPTDLSQKKTDTSLIERFLYPKLGPGQLWEEVAQRVIEMGGVIHTHHSVTKLYFNGKNEVVGIDAKNEKDNSILHVKGSYFFSTMPIKELVAGMNVTVPPDVSAIANGLQYRDFITVGVLLNKLIRQDKDEPINDNWIYIQEKNVGLGRLQVFNNWSPYMVKDPGTMWLGLEYFCNVGDDFWDLSDDEICKVAIEDLVKIGMIEKEDAIDSVVIRMEKTYPAYFGTYKNFDQLRAYLDKIPNLFLVGRNGMHKYNNADHSMLTAMTAVDNIVSGTGDKENIWAINTEQDYHEKNDEPTV